MRLLSAYVTAAKEARHYANINLSKLLSEKCPFKNKLKFVINLSSYDAKSFCRITQTKDSSLYKQQCDFIHYLHENQINNITANVVMTDILKNNLGEYFNTWKKLGIRTIAFSYAIQAGINTRNRTNSINVLSKEECLTLYNSLGCGSYPLECFDNIELMIPSCDEKNCKESRSIISCYEKSKDCWTFKHGCIDT